MTSTDRAISVRGVVRRPEFERRAAEFGWMPDPEQPDHTEWRRDGWRIRATWSRGDITGSMAVFNPDGRLIESSTFLIDKWAVQAELWDRLENPAGPDAPPDGAALAADVLAYAEQLRGKAPEGLFGLIAVADRLEALVAGARR